MTGKYPIEIFAETPAEPMPQQEAKKPVLTKPEDSKMPVFARDVPVSSKKKVQGSIVTVNHEWKVPETVPELDSLKVSQLVFRNGENMEYFSKVNVRDGYDRIAIVYNRITYFLRKTNFEVARALFNAAGKINGSIESVIGYLKTMLGNFYVVSRVEKGSWVFDKKLANEHVSHADAKAFDAVHKEKLVSMVVESMTTLHRQRLVLGKFSLDNLLLTANALLFTDLRKMRVSRKSAFLVEEFVAAMRYLVSNGIATNADATHAVMTYSVEMEDACNCWYRERNGRSAKDPMLVVEEMEKELKVSDAAFALHQIPA